MEMNQVLKTDKAKWETINIIENKESKCAL